ncbi:VOC family protein [Sphingomonas crusticola]|uniref:VOC family protein n=1 Tax=Sphingomonas crusticola TaxID=1697973 RepID=UPI000E2484DC|nr:VOC family protein [Sphingomonas crusticola]
MAPSHLALVSLLVPDYEEGLQFYVEVLGFELREDTVISADKRWVVVAPRGGQCAILLARAASPDQRAAIGKQAGGRVFLFLTTDDFAGDHAALLRRGVQFVESPRDEPYGTVAVFVDPFGNRWDLVQPRHA